MRPSPPSLPSEETSAAVRERERASGLPEELRGLQGLLGALDGAGLAYFDAEGRHRYVSGPYAALLGAGAAAPPASDAHRAPPPAEELVRALAGAADALSASLDLRATLAAIGALAVPALADWCAVDVLADDGRLERLEVAHADPERAHLAARVRALAPVDVGGAGGATGPGGVGHAVDPGHAGADGRRAPPAHAVQMHAVQVVEDFAPLLERALREGTLEPGSERAQLLSALAPRSLLVAPLLSRGRRLGALTLLTNAASGRRYGPRDVALGEALARRVALALDNALLHRAAQEARERIERLQAVTAALSEAASPAEVADVIASQGTLALGADAGVVMVLSGDGRELRLASARGYPAEALARWGHLPLELSHPLTDAVRAGDPTRVVQLPTLLERDRRYPHLAAGPRVPHEALAAVALRAGGRVMGVVGLSFLGPRALQAPERELLLALARQGGQALERARLYEAERRARREAQEALRAGEVARAQLAASEARFRRVVDSGMLGICFWDASGRVTDANAVFLSLVGRSRQELGLLRLDALFPEPLAHEELERRGVHAPYETELARADGARVPVLMGGARLSPGGAGVSFVLDVTERHRAEAERADTLSLLGSLLATAPVGLCFVDRSLRFTHVNESLAALTHAPVEAHLGRSVSDVAPAALALALQGSFRRVFAEGVALPEQELAAPRADGSPGHFQASFYPVLDRTGQVALAGAVLVDLTERKHAEEQLEEAAEFRERFLGIVSHDLRTPLQASMLAASLLLRAEDLPERHQKLARRIATSTERMGRMISELLDFTRSRLGGGIPVERRAVDLAGLCQEVLDEVGLGAGEGQLQLILEGNEGEGPCTGEWDPGRIAQVVQNLVTNALKHGAPGAPVTLRLVGEAEGVRLSVHNRGAPIPPTLLPELFNPFRRGARRSAASGASEGLGLGLYIARAVLAAHGGHIEAHSSAEEGTTFQVYLPRGPG
ncbi:PAS domain S-box protein [Aggregicoccus sp. 17bor-14]|uniref:ATP-binding protein n=1 Tax=Myxococcaceae TaxID=31 RepID=UPI00129C9E64|nr:MULTISPECIES: ATP-binding protein [Myxococcaceae]MBF5045255.1 PAS domain-containing protein [Simulacricoccus sp. 17bor-14]MRI90996.1 PAS domain S-box protein [Aggregicoccus sp. 17bor-14]